MSLKIHLRVKHDEFLLETLSIGTHKVILAKVKFKRIVIDVVLLFPSLRLAVAYVASLVFVSTVCIQLVVAIEPLSTKPTLWMTFKTALVDGPWIVISKLLMLP
jgi:hypothetical protein